MADSSDLAGIIGTVGALGIESYQLSQGQEVSTTVGPGGASIIQSGQAATQSTLFLVVIGLTLALVVVYFFLK